MRPISRPWGLTGDLLDVEGDREESSQVTLAHDCWDIG